MHETRTFRQRLSKGALALTLLLPAAAVLAQPVVTITAPESVVGRTRITYTLTSTPPPAANLEVTLGRSFFTAAVTIPAGQSTLEGIYPFFHPDLNDTPAEDSAATLTVRSGTGYVVGEPSSMRVTVLDDDTTMMISSQATSVIEGRAAAEFTVTPDPSPSLVTRTVEVDLTVTGDFELVGDALREVVIAKDDPSATFSVEIAGDDIVDAQGELRADIRSGAWKTADDSRSASVTILDNNIVVTISPPAEPISEGATAMFTLNLMPTPTSDLSVNVAYTGGEAGLPAAAGATSLPLNVNTSAGAGDSTVTATVQTGEGYVVGTQSTASVTVLDADAVVSISAQETSVAEGRSVEFTVSADPPPPSPRTVWVDIAVPSGDFELVGNARREVMLAQDAASATFSVSTLNDNEQERDGSLTATLATGPGYRLGTTVTAAVTIEDSTGDPDVNASGSVDAGDALILYYAYSLRNDLGNGR